MKRTKPFFAIILLILLGVLFGNTVLASDREQRVQFSAPILVANTSFLNVRTGPGAQYPVLITVVGGTELPVLAVASDLVWYQISTVVGTGWVNVEFTIPRGDFSNVPVIRLSDIVDFEAPTLASLGQGGGATTPDVGVGGAPVAVASGGTSCFATTATMTAPSVNLLAQPSASAQVLAVLFYQGGQADYPVVGQSGGFIQLNVGGVGSGWADASQFFLRPSGAVGLTVVVITDNLFITGEPYSQANPLVVNVGTEVFVVEANQANYRVRTIAGDTFYVEIGKTRIRTEASSDQQADVACNAAVPSAGASGNPTTGATPVFVVPQIDVTNGPHVVINTGFLNIRSGPGGQYSVVTTVNGGTELAVIGVIQDSEWYLVRGAFGQGWVDSEFVIFRGVMDNVPVINYSSITTGSLSQPVVIISSSATLYAAPGTNFGTIGTLAGPIEVAIVARTADNAWLQVNTSLGFGWVWAQSILIRGDLTLVPVVS